MRIKTYYAQTMPDALRDIKAELGPEALLLSTSETPCRSGVRSSMFEVVAAIDTGHDPEAAGQVHADADEAAYSAAPAEAGQNEPCANDGKEDPPSTVEPANKFSRAASALYDELMAGDVHEWLARRLITESMQMLNKRQRRNRSLLLQGMRSVAGGLMAAWDPAGELPRRRVMAFVGPTGVGKTTTIAKLAARLALEKRKRVVLLTLDGYRIGAVEQLRTYAALMGVPFRFVADLAELPAVLREQAERDYVLVDTTGRAPRDGSGIEDLSRLADPALGIERHLVLSATTKPSDLDEVVERFGPCSPDCLVFTRVDETRTLGPILNQLVRTGKPLSYYADGQRVPEDLHMLPKEQVLDIVFNQP